MPRERGAVGASCRERGSHPLGTPWYPGTRVGEGEAAACGPPNLQCRAQTTNLSVRTCHWSRGSSCVSPDPFPSKHRGLPAPTTRIIAFLACLGRLLPSPPFLLSSQLGQFSIGFMHPPPGPMLPLAAGQRSAGCTPHPSPRAPAHAPPPPPQARGARWDLAPPSSEQTI